MTTREFYTAIINTPAADIDYIREDLIEKANELLASLDRKNEARKSKPSKSSLEAAGRKLTVLSVLSYETYRNRDEVAEEAGCTPGQATAALTALVKEGLAEKIEGKGKGGKTTYCRVFIED